jgi:hypothetical protein
MTSAMAFTTALRDRTRLGPEEQINFRDIVNIVSVLVLAQRFAGIAPEYVLTDAGVQLKLSHEQQQAAP